MNYGRIIEAKFLSRGGRLSSGIPSNYGSTRGETGRDDGLLPWIIDSWILVTLAGFVELTGPCPS